MIKSNAINRPISLYTSEECEKIAESAALRYVTDADPGITCYKRGRGYFYTDFKGEKISNPQILQRIKDLKIPNAYKQVWICRFANGHIQATGIDDKGRKQYLYHPLWHQIRQQQKFSTLLEFGRCLPVIRKHVHEELTKPLRLGKEQVLCAIIYLLDTTCIRIGTPLYAKKNNSYGITTLRKKHLSISNNEALLDFRGKNSKLWHVVLKDKKLIKLLKKSEEIPGYALFKYYDEEGKINVISSQDVNGYLQSLTNSPFTAKDFRTWTACREMLFRLITAECTSPSNNAIKPLICEVAKILGHTPSICRKNYIDPVIIQCWEKGHLTQWFTNKSMTLDDKDQLLLYWLEQKEDFS